MDNFFAIDNFFQQGPYKNLTSANSHRKASNELIYYFTPYLNT